MDAIKSFDISLDRVTVNLPSGAPLFLIPKLDIPFGTHLLIRGESGSGKTTFLHLLAGLLSADSGDIMLGQSRLRSFSDDDLCTLRLNHVGVIFQKLNIVEHFTVAENVRLAAVHHADQAQPRGRAAMRSVNMDARENDRASFLSLGEQQRVAVARVLAQGPQIILADEPTSSLDLKNTIFVIEALKDAARGKTLIVVSHDDRIARYFDNVVAFQEYTQWRR